MGIRRTRTAIAVAALAALTLTGCASGDGDGEREDAGASEAGAGANSLLGGGEGAEALNLACQSGGEPVASTVELVKNGQGEIVVTADLAGVEYDPDAFAFKLELKRTIGAEDKYELTALFDRSVDQLTQEPVDTYAVVVSEDAIGAISSDHAVPVEGDEATISGEALSVTIPQPAAEQFETTFLGAEFELLSVRTTLGSTHCSFDALPQQTSAAVDVICWSYDSDRKLRRLPDGDSPIGVAATSDTLTITRDDTLAHYPELFVTDIAKPIPLSADGESLLTKDPDGTWTQEEYDAYFDYWDDMDYDHPLAPGESVDLPRADVPGSIELTDDPGLSAREGLIRCDSAYVVTPEGW